MRLNIVRGGKWVKNCKEKYLSDEPTIEAKTSD